MSLTKIDVTAAGSYYLETGEVHGDIVSPVHGSLAIYTYAAAGEFIGKEYSFATTTGWFPRNQISEGADSNAAIPTIQVSRPATPGTSAEMATDAAAIITANAEVSNSGKRWENTTNGVVYDFRVVNEVWDYYKEETPDENGNTATSLKTLISGEDQSNDCLVVEEQNGYDVFDRNTEAADYVLGTTGASGDLLVRVRVTTQVVVADLNIYDGTVATGTLILSIPSGTVAGVSYECGFMSKNGGFTCADNASVGAVIAVGRFS